MVTIEQKLSLFSKLLQQDIKDEISGKLALIEEEYKQKQIEHNEIVDKEARLMVDRAIKKAELKRTEMVSKAKMQAKKQAMTSKDKCVNLCMIQLKEHINKFIKSDAYEAYLLKVIDNIRNLGEIKNQIIIHMTKEDIQRYKEQVSSYLESLEIESSKVVIEACETPILGGVIVEIPSENIRMDLSIMTMLEDSKSYIVEQVFEAIEQVGEASE
ncbi:MAG: V-type ATP synthase subunit E family protein [Cellulosilyticaceae bacterium]